MLVSSLFPFLLINSYLRKVLDLLVTHYRSSADAWAWKIIFGFNDSTSLMRIISRKMKEPHDGTHHAALKMASISYTRPSAASVGSSIADVIASPLSAWKAAIASRVIGPSIPSIGPS